MTKEIQTQLTELREKLDSLQQQRDDLWNLRFKDFEDLARAIDNFDDDWKEVDCLRYDIIKSLEAIYIKEGMEELDAYDRAHEYVSEEEEKVDHFLNELNYFRQKSIF